MAGLSRKHPKIVKVKEYGWGAGNPSPPSLNGWDGE